MNNQQFIYAGYVKGGDRPGAPNWKLIPDTPEERAKALEEGYDALTILSVSHPYDPERKEEPNRKGPLVLDFDLKGDPKKAIRLARQFVIKLAERYKLHVDSLRYWISGGKGCHIEIPDIVTGSEAGHPYLPNIHRLLVFFLEKECFGAFLNGKLIDLQMYCGGKGRLLRVENIKRDNGRYKVPVSSKEFLELDIEELEKLADSPRIGFETGHKVDGANPLLAAKFQKVKEIIEMGNVANPVAILEAMSRCAFFNKCIEAADTLSEPEWWAFISNLAPLKAIGLKLAHSFSEPYPRYTPEETDRKFAEAVKVCKPKTCAYIHEQGWVACPEDCNMGAPCSLFKVKNIVPKEMLFQHEPDGLYYKEGAKLIKICSPIKVVGRACDYDNGSWCRIAQITDPMGNVKRRRIAMRDFAEPGYKWLSPLLAEGLEIEEFPNAKKLLREYIQHGELDCEILRISEKIGWLPDGSYLLPDCQYGAKEKTLFTGKLDTRYGVAGSLDDWKDKVGKYCAGNPLLIFATCFALTGIMLEPTGSEGGGLHIYGGSSKGKSTVAVVGGSVCGGGKAGFMYQWRGTDNAMENVAENHNHNLLVLDEVSQVSSTALANLAYMLSNQKGKLRMNKNGENRRENSWNMNFLSTGELTIADKIMEDGRLKTHAGQEVRIINLPIDGGDSFEGYTRNLHPFVNLHDIPTARELSDLLKYNAKSIYGAPMRHFIEQLVEDREKSVAKVKESMKEFVEKNLPEDCGGQVQRVLVRFALIAATGELAIEFGTMPYDKGDAAKAARTWFKIWLKQRNGLEDAEILRAIDRIRQHFEQSSLKYQNLDEARDGTPKTRADPIPGYMERDDKGATYYYMLGAKFRELCNPANLHTVKEKLAKLGWLKRTSTGKIMETISVNNINERIVAFIRIG